MMLPLPLLLSNFIIHKSPVDKQKAPDARSLGCCVRRFLIGFLRHLGYSISKDVIQSSMAFTNTNCCRKTAIPVAGIPVLFSFSAILVSK